MSTRRAFLPCLLVGATGCALPVRENALHGYSGLQVLQWRSFVDERLRGQVRLGSLQGADPAAVGFLQAMLEHVWDTRLPAKPVADAIGEQLDRLRLLASLAERASYQLDATILQLDASPLPLLSEGDAELHWQIKEISSGRLVFDRRLRSQGSVPVAPIWPPLRARIAKESALRANLAKLAEALVRLRV